MPKTLVINNFSGRITRFSDGDINSGLAKYETTYGIDPFTKPGNLTWMEQPIQIDSGGTVITDTIMAGKTRLDADQTFVYVIGSNARLYKIQVNNSSGNNPNYDTPSLISTLSAQNPSFAFGASMQFFGATERIYIGTSQGVNRVDFTGANDTFVGSISSFVSGSSGASALFLGKLYYANGNNLAEIDSTGTVTNYNKLSPAFPTGTYIRDLKVSPDGLYLQIVVSTVPTSQINFFPQEGLGATNANSWLFLWNGTDTGYTAYSSYNNYSMGANLSFGSHSYTMGQDMDGAAIYDGTVREISLPKYHTPINNALFSSGNMIGFATGEYSQSASVLQASIGMYGQYDREIPNGFYRLGRISAITPATDVLKIPFCLPVTTNFYNESSAGYTNQLGGSGKIYYSTFESQYPSSVLSKLYKFTLVPTGLNSVMGGVYETQTQLFSKKIKPSEVRIYGEPWVANNAFKVDLIGSSGSSIIGGSYTFEVGNSSTLASGQDYAWYNPATAPTYALGLRITNLGSANHVINKAEIDYDTGGK